MVLLNVRLFAGGGAFWDPSVSGADSSPNRGDAEPARQRGSKGGRLR